MSKVLIIDTDYIKINQDISKIFNEFVTDLKGKKVFVKPNILGAFPPEKHVTTHPAVVKAIVKYLLDHEADVIVGDNTGMPRAYGKNEHAAKVSGILEASQNRFQNIGKKIKMVKLNFDKNPEIPFSSVVFDCDIFISVPKFKTHLNTIITGAIKNSYGLVVGPQKNRLHFNYPVYSQFAEVVVSVFEARKPDLIIMDAVKAMEGEGPNSPDLRDLNKIIASNDALSTDAVMCHMMKIEQDRVDTIRIAKNRKLGEADLSKIEIIGELITLNDFKLPSTYGKSDNRESFANTLISKVVRSGKLKVNNRNCILCAQCYESCPANAITYDKDKGPTINNNKCILCFCCKELCPNGAITLTGIYGVLQKI